MEEFYLRDYLRIIWQRKWVIIGISIIFLIVGFIYTSLRNNEYEAHATLNWARQPKVQGLYPLWSTFGQFVMPSSDKFQLPSSNEVVALMRTYEIFNLSLSVALLENTSSLISVNLKGTRSPSELEKLLTEFISQRQKFFEDHLQDQVSQAKGAIERGRQFFLEERTELLNSIEGWVESRRNGLTVQHDILLGQLKSVRKEDIRYLSLVSQLQAIEAELLRLQAEGESAFLQSGTGLESQLAEIDRTLRAFDLSMQEIEYLESIQWTPLQIITPAKASSEPINPSRSLILLIALLLGIFLGTLLVFFLHYAQDSSAKTRPTLNT